MATTFTLLNKERREDTLFTTVQYTIDGVVLEPIIIPHFQPTSKAEVRQAIINRGISEKKRLDSAALIDTFINNLDQS